MTSHNKAAAIVDLIDSLIKTRIDENFIARNGEDACVESIECSSIKDKLISEIQDT